MLTSDQNTDPREYEEEHPPASSMLGVDLQGVDSERVVIPGYDPFESVGG